MLFPVRWLSAIPSAKKPHTKQYVFRSIYLLNNLSTNVQDFIYIQITFWDVNILSTIWFLHFNNQGIIEKVQFVSCIYISESFTGIQSIKMKVFLFLSSPPFVFLLHSQVETSDFWLVLFRILSLLHDFFSLWSHRPLEGKKNTYTPFMKIAQLFQIF